MRRREKERCTVYERLWFRQDLFRFGLGCIVYGFNPDNQTFVFPEAVYEAFQTQIRVVPVSQEGWETSQRGARTRFEDQLESRRLWASWWIEERVN